MQILNTEMPNKHCLPLSMHALIIDKTKFGKSDENDN